MSSADPAVCDAKAKPYAAFQTINPPKMGEATSSKAAAPEAPSLPSLPFGGAQAAFCAPCGEGGFCDPVTRGSHPPWRQPVGSPEGNTGLRVNNSLTDEKELFLPYNGRVVNWYTCGPTVYDKCHMGHARAYLTFDILRRIMEDYLGYQVFMQVNVTDIDDKIIIKGRKNFLLKQYKEQNKSFADVCTDVDAAMETAKGKMAKKLEELKKDMPAGTPKREVEERKTLLQQAELKATQLEEQCNKVADSKSSGSAETMVTVAHDLLCDKLDGELGHTVVGHEAFDAVSRQYEREYLEDMDALGVRYPDIITRVTEYVPEVVAFIQRVVDKKYAYESNGSVYMDIGEYKKRGHDYPKLCPESGGGATAAEMAEGEGALSGGGDSEKKSPNDFALWKKSKPGEPSWDSPWGKGRPGWHIECSVMASEVIGDQMDIHAGGVDLKFPHHDNEIAQAEAYHECNQWVHYFFHAGHLHIKGLKMSKSLKNFITIRQALETYSARQLRIMFLLQPWDKPMDFSDQTIQEAKKREGTFKNFFGQVKALLRSDWLKQPTYATKLDIALLEKYNMRESAVHTAILDNFDTPKAMLELVALMTDVNTYITDAEGKQPPNMTLVKKVAVYITKMLRVFGIAEQDEFGLPVGEAGGADYESNVTPFIDAVQDFREQVRTIAKSLGSKELLALCDQVRDETMVECGVRLEDKAEGSVWKLDDKETMKRELAAKKEAEREQKLKKLNNKLTQRQETLTKWTDAALDPKELFLKGSAHAGKFSGIGDDGLPTKDGQGTELSKGAKKNLGKMVKNHEKAKDDLQKELAKNANCVEDIKAEIADLEAQIAAV